MFFFSRFIGRAGIAVLREPADTSDSAKAKSHEKKDPTAVPPTPIKPRPR